MTSRRPRRGTGTTATPTTTSTINNARLASWPWARNHYVCQEKQRLDDRSCIFRFKLNDNLKESRSNIQ